MFRRIPSLAHVFSRPLFCLALLLVASCHAPWAGQLALRQPSIKAVHVWRHPGAQKPSDGTFSANVLPPKVTLCGGRVFSISAGGILAALQKETGALAWTLQLGAARFPSPLCIPKNAESGGGLVLANDRGDVLWIDETGRIRWKIQLDEPVLSSLAFGDNLLFVQPTGGRLRALVPSDGKTAWSSDSVHPTPELYRLDLDQGPVYAAGTVYAGFSDGTLTATDAISGETRWNFLFANAEGLFPHLSTPFVADDALYVAHHTNGLYRFDLSKQQTVVAPTWSYLLHRTENPHASAVWADPGRKIVCTVLGVGGIHCLDTDGHVLWRQHTWSMLSGISAWKDVLLFSRKDHGVYGVRAHDGAWMLHIPTGGMLVSQPIVSGDMVYFADASGAVTALRLVQQR